MANINLLPWREELRKKRQQEFIITAAAAALLMAGVMVGVHMYYAGKIDYQNRRNAFLEQEIELLNEKIAEIKELRKERDALIARTKVIQRLQSGRPEIVHLFDQMVRTLPEGVYYTKLAQKGRNLSLSGKAQSNARVSSLMRQLDGSEWLDTPVLVGIVGKEDEGTGLRVSEFDVGVKQTEQKKEGEEGEEGETAQ